MIKQLELDAPAKINWSLAIVGRRADGYHLLRSLMQSVGLTDTVCLRRSAVDECLVQPPLAGDNLALAAWLALKQDAGLTDSLSIRIEKRIPLGGGLAGGSADAAAVLVGANRLFGLDYCRQQLCEIGLKLGMDLPFCLHGGLALVEGAGERVTRLCGAPVYHLVLVNPGLPVATPLVYREYDRLSVPPQPNIDALQAAVLAGDYHAIALNIGNALFPAAASLHPQLSRLDKQLAAAERPYLMSGSGSSFWLLAESAQDAAAMAEQLKTGGNWAAAVQTSNIGFELSV